MTRDPSNRLVKLSEFKPDGGHAYVCRLPADFTEGDTNEDPHRSNLDLLEDGRGLGPSHSEHALIRERGGGLYSHWHGFLYFSASDHSDPRNNGRSYYAYVPAADADPIRQRLANLASINVQAGTDAAYAVAESMFATLYPEAIVGEIGKACWRDRRFLSDYDRLLPGNRRSFERKYVVAQLVEALRSIDGEMAECGVYNGSTAFFMAQASLESGRRRALHLFDSFEGLSEPDRVDGRFWSRGDLSIPESTARATLHDFSEVTFYRGWIPSRFDEVSDRRFAFVHIDVDLHQPTLDSMRFFYPRMAAGGVIVCDDYGFTTCPGARQAVDEYMTDRPEAVIHLPTGQAVIIRHSS